MTTIETFVLQEVTRSRPSVSDQLITFIPLISGSLGVLGSSVIMYNILSDPQRRFQTPYFRIMFCLSLADMIYAINKMVSVFAIPKNISIRYYASGNQATCVVTGFLNQLGMIQPLYTSSLCIYFWLVIKYGKADEYIRKRVELWMHTLSVGIPLISAIVGLGLGLYTPSFLGCNLGLTKMYGMLYRGLIVMLSFAMIVYTMISVIWFVRKRERIMNRRMSFTTAKKKVQVVSQRIVENKRQVMKQAILYVSAYFLVWFFGYVAKISEYVRQKPSTVLLIIHQFFNPMQGFLNFIIYFVPRYIKVKEEHRDKSFSWILKETIVTKTRDKVQRRSSRVTYSPQYPKSTPNCETRNLHIIIPPECVLALSDESSTSSNDSHDATSNIHAMPIMESDVESRVE